MLRGTAADQRADRARATLRSGFARVRGIRATPLEERRREIDIEQGAIR